MHKFCKISIAVWTAFCVLGLVVGLSSVGHIKTSNEFEQAGAAIGTAMGVGFWISLWFFPTVGLGIIALITCPKETVAVQVVQATTLCADCGKYYSGAPGYCPNCGARLAKGGQDVGPSKPDS